MAIYYVVVVNVIIIIFIATLDYHSLSLSGLFFIYEVLAIIKTAFFKAVSIYLLLKKSLFK